MEERTYRPRLVAGVLAVAWLLFGSRWGSYVGVAPLFLTDVLLAVATVHYLVSIARTPQPRRDELRPRAFLLFALTAWASLRFLLGEHYSLTALRDFVPYFYATVGVLAAFAVSQAGAEARARTARWMVWALGLHAAWFVLVTLVAPSLPLSLPLISADQGLHLFTLREDVDTVFAGVFAGWLISVMLTRRRVFWPLLGFLVVWAAILQISSRAGVGAALLVTVLGLIAAQSSGEAKRHRAALVVAVLPLMLAGFLAFLPQTDFGQRVAGTFGAQTDLGEQAAGTTQARADSWPLLLGYTTQTLGRTTVGVGFGPDFMSDSGAALALVGPQPLEGFPRSPHDYWLGTFARLGLVGLMLALTLGATVLLAGWRQVRRPAVGDDLGLLCALLGVGLLPVATLGVVLESPFGAVPFFWAAGVLLAYPRGQVTSGTSSRSSARSLSRSA